MRAALAALFLIAAAPVAGPAAWAQPTSPAPASEVSSPFEAAVGEAKSAMMGDPQRAHEAAQRAAGLAAAEADPLYARLTAQWLQAEALNRMNRSKEAAPLLDRAIADAETRPEVVKLNGDLLMARALSARVDGQYAMALDAVAAAGGLDLHRCARLPPRP